MRLGGRGLKDMANEKIARAALLATVVAVLAATAAMQNHPAEAAFRSEHRLPDGEADFYFDRSTLNRLNVDGDTTNNYQKVKASFERAMDRYNRIDRADLDMSTSARYQSSDYTVYGKDMGPLGFSAQAVYPEQALAGGDKFVRFNTWRAWGTDGGCRGAWFFIHAYNIEWITNHELGHVVGLEHQPAGSPSTMVHKCSSTWSKIQDTDKDNIRMGY